jgi:photosystem II stability/assembly factor-like uncharacterized protein
MKIRNTFFILALLIFLFSIQANAQYNWQTLTNAPQSWRLDDFYFLNPSQGWAISPYYNYLSPTKQGQIWGTSDGGATWQKLKDNSHTFYRSIGFADANNGWVGNLADTSKNAYSGVPYTTDTIPLYHTSDGGLTWLPVMNLPSPRPKGICGISVVTDSIIYAYGRFFGPAVLLKTIDKGATWMSQSLGAYASGLIDAKFFDKDTGFVTASSITKKAMLLSTFDGGASWQIRYQSTRADTEGVWKIVFPSRQIGYASIENWNISANPHQNHFLKTTDGGMTWTEMPFVSPYDLQGIGFINDSVGWIGGDFESRTYKTTDGGITWAKDYGFGTTTPPYNSPGFACFSINRFRRFGDTLMYASGNTVYKLQTGANTGINILTKPLVIMSNFPNPFKYQTTLSYSLTAESSSVEIIIYNLLGEPVLYRNIESQLAGDHETILNLDVPEGIYYCTISSGLQKMTKKIAVCK